MKKLGRILPWIAGAAAVLLLANPSAWTDSMVVVTSQSAQNANDSVDWSQLGADATNLAASFGATSANGNGITATLAGPNSLTAVVCPATPCSWVPGFTTGDTLIWTSDAANGGNGPITLAFSKAIVGAGALIKADGPGQFTAQIQAFNNGTLLGTFSQVSNSTGDPVYLGVNDISGANVTSVVFSLTACAQGSCNDFALD
jgi:hypothetical protein